ncbi:MAG: IS66 family transposase [Cytophagaceae bacterium]|nr:IS66 family transposase [Cytophagaceae bacterium]
MNDISDLSKDELIVEVMQLQHRLSMLEKMVFGPKHERFIPASDNQLTLEMAVESSAEQVVKITEVPAHKRVEVKKKEKFHPGRNPLPSSLRREEIILEPSEDVSDCVCIGEEISEVLEVKAAEFFVKRTVRKKYARKNEEGIAIASLESRVIDKGIAGSSVLAMLIVSKFIDHLPIHRQIAIFKRISVELKYNTVLDWSNQSLNVLIPLYDLLKKKVFEGGYIQADETTLKVLDNEKSGSAHQGYLWAYRNPIEKLIFFEYQPGRGKSGPAELLRNFKGHLQTDGYGANDQFSIRSEIEVLNCMAHARRYFKEAEDNDKVRAEYVLTEIQKLYSIERGIKELSVEEKYRVRQEQSLPVLKALGHWMIEQYPQVTPKSAIGKALEYSIKRWKELSRYVNNGHLQIDNNQVENDIRPIALGRKNYLFAGSHESAQRIAMIYSLLGTCKAYGINPHEWLTKVFEEIPNRKVNNLEDLLPQNFISNM